LIDVQTGEVIMADQVDGKYEEVLTLMNKIAETMWKKLTGETIDEKEGVTLENTKVTITVVDFTNIVTIGVIDFINLNKDPQLDYLVKGIPETIITYLSKKEKGGQIVRQTRLDVPLRRLKLGIDGIIDEQTAVKIGKTTGAMAIIVGSFKIFRGNVRINIRLVDVQTGEIITAEQVQGPLGQIFPLMDRASEAIWAKLVGRYR